MVRGYPDHPSVSAGEDFAFHVASDQSVSAFRIYFFRLGTSWQLMGMSDRWQAGCFPAGLSTESWCWPAYQFHIPQTWPSGAYIACFISETDSIEALAIEPDNPEHRNTALFVIKGPRQYRPGKAILYKLPFFTYCAYNCEGGGSLYTGPGNKVTLQRPGCGAGGDPFDKAVVDVYDTSSPRQTFAHWDAPFVRWLESSGYEVDYCTDLDLHQNADGLLDSHQILLSVGHDEYWTQGMRTNAERFLAGGGNIAFFSGNTCWWRVHMVDADSAFTCEKRKRAGDSEAFDQWMRFDPETRLTGVSFRFGGGWWSGRRESLGYTVQYADHWAYKGTGLKDGDTFGASSEQALVGYECDGAPLSRQRDSHGYLLPDHKHGTPATFQVLGVGPLSSKWEYRETETAAATLGVYTHGGTVFTAATTDWARVLHAGDPIVDRITRNVLDRLTYKQHVEPDICG
jgi:hypothetical protein